MRFIGRVLCVMRTFFCCFMLLLPAAGNSEDRQMAALRGQVVATEQAFARSMADRDFQAFQAFLATDAVFFNGKRALRGKDAVAAAWKPFFDDEGAPFSWSPETVEVLASGDLALSTGPVFDAAGNRIAAFNSIWRRDGHGRWRIVFDKGEQVCNDTGAGGLNGAPP